MRKIGGLFSALLIGVVGLVGLSSPAQADDQNEFASWTVDCGSVTFTNLLDYKVRIFYGSEGATTPDGMLELEPGESSTVATDNWTLSYEMLSPDLSIPEPAYGTIDVTQGCDVETPTKPRKTKAKPKVAPAAGV